MQQTLLNAFFPTTTSKRAAADIAREGTPSTASAISESTFVNVSVAEQSSGVSALGAATDESVYNWAELQRTLVAPDVRRFQRDVLVGDTYLGRALSDGAAAWGSVSTLAFVRAEQLGEAGLLLSVARFDERGAGTVTSVVMSEAFALERARGVLSGASQVVIVGHNVEDVSPLLDFDARIVARRSGLSLRAHEVGVLRALRDEAWHLGGRLRQDVDATDALTMEWLVQRAEAEVLCLVVSSLPPAGRRSQRPTLH